MGDNDNVCVHTIFRSNHLWFSAAYLFKGVTSVWNALEPLWFSTIASVWSAAIPIDNLNVRNSSLWSLREPRHLREEGKLLQHYIYHYYYCFVFFIVRLPFNQFYLFAIISLAENFVFFFTFSRYNKCTHTQLIIICAQGPCYELGLIHFILVSSHSAAHRHTHIPAKYVAAVFRFCCNEQFFNLNIYLLFCICSIIDEAKSILYRFRYMTYMTISFKSRKENETF